MGACLVKYIDAVVSSTLGSASRSTMTPYRLTLSGVESLPHHTQKMWWFWIGRRYAQEDSRHSACLVELFGLARDILL